MIDFLNDNPPPDQASIAVNAAYDSVNLINYSITLSASCENEMLVERNVDHLNIMMGKSWFVSALSGTQSDDMNAAITAGQNYINSKP
jgi:hypothetical protein